LHFSSSFGGFARKLKRILFTSINSFQSWDLTSFKILKCRIRNNLLFFYLDNLQSFVKMRIVTSRIKDNSQFSFSHQHLAHFPGLQYEIPWPFLNFYCFYKYMECYLSWSINQQKLLISCSWYSPSIQL
jgi:hypothetical protein